MLCVPSSVSTVLFPMQGGDKLSKNAKKKLKKKEKKQTKAGAGDTGEQFPSTLFLSPNLSSTESPNLV